MRRRLIICLIMVFFSFSLLGCNNLGGVLNPNNSQGNQTKAGSDKSSVKADLDNYVNNGLSDLADLEQEALDSYGSVSGDNYTDDATMYKEMKNVTVPKYNEFVQKLKKLKPKTVEVQEVNNLYVTGANIQLDAFNQILTALQKKDSKLVEEANKKLSTAGDTIDKFREKITELADEYGVDLNLSDLNSSASQPAVSVADDLIDYINVQLVKVSSIENEAVSAYESVSGSNYTNDNVMYQTLVNTVIPKYQQFLNILQSIKPKTKEVSDIHQTYISGAKTQMEGFKLVEQALKNKDSNLVKTANSKLNQGLSLINKFNSDLEALAKKNNVKIN